ncbi:DUF2917 domain-containing protein [Ramlibacter sp.]|uniref:DUF2917 domain-containing protein n=1 Tax=Ramlibacter sp. TaxID=1917967 RepID=UPI003D0F180B
MLLASLLPFNLPGRHSAPTAEVRRRRAYQLAAGASEVVVPQPHRFEVHCASGELWITYDGDQKDVFVAAGGSYVTDRFRPMRVTALKPSVFEVSWIAPRTPARRASAPQPS